MEIKSSPKILLALLELLTQTDGYVSITYVAGKLHISWPFAKMLLLRLMAEGKVEGEEIARRGWIFRSKKLTEPQVMMTEVR